MTAFGAGVAVGLEEWVIRFVDAGAEGALLRFAEPAGRCAVRAPGSDGDLVVRVLRGAEELGPEERKWLGRASLQVKLRGAEVRWRVGHALLRCEGEQVEAMLRALVEFAYYEGELRGLEREIAAGWGEVEADKRLAFDVGVADLRAGGGLGERMGRAFGRRIRLARMQRELYEPGAEVMGAARKLGEELREAAGMEGRVEAVEAQCEVVEHVYEMASQRMGEFRAAHQGHVMEWVIIVLLAVEAVVMVGQALWRR